LAQLVQERRLIVSRDAIRRTTVPAGDPVGTVGVSIDDAGQVLLLMSDETGEALQAALSPGQAARLGWNLIWLAQPKSAATQPPCRAS
jgi:hypothetical protein